MRVSGTNSIAVMMRTIMCARHDKRMIVNPRTQTKYCPACVERLRMQFRLERNRFLKPRGKSCP
jgi:hypothetical protein